MNTYFDMSLTFDDIRSMIAVVNQGIDSRLTAFTQSSFELHDREYVTRLDCKIHSSEMEILIRRLLDLEMEAAELLADDIVTIEYDVEIY